MTDYTPTTEIVEANYEYSNWLQRAGNREKYEAEFNRWLAEVRADAFAQGRDSQRDHAEQMERERIIKLLEDAITDDEDAYRINWAIEIIKGENSE